METRHLLQSSLARLRTPASVALAVTLASMMLAPARPVAAAVAPAVGTVTNYVNPGLDRPWGIVAAPDGALWFTNSGNGSIGRVTTDGEVTSYAGAGISEPEGIVLGPDGALWFTNHGNDSIGRMTLDGVVSNYKDGTISGPRAITVGPDGAMWFTNTNGAGRIGRVTVDGDLSSFTDPANEFIPGDITTGPDGALWFTEPWMTFGTIGRMTTDGAFSYVTDASIDSPQDIVTGPDGALWFTQPNLGSIGRMVPGESATTFDVPNAYGLQAIAVGPDGAMWFTNLHDMVGRVLGDGTVSTWTAPAIGDPLDITAGPDGNLWFTNLGNTVGRITPDGATVSMFPGRGISDPTAIAHGSDGNLWFINRDNDSIGRVTPDGYVTAYSGAGISGLSDIVAGPDGALWFTNQTSRSIGRITTAGVVTTYTDGNIGIPLDITAGPDGAMWFTDSTSAHGSIARMTTAGVITARYSYDYARYGYGLDAPQHIAAGPDGALWYLTNIGKLGRITTDGSVSYWIPANHFVKRIAAGPDGALWMTTASGTTIMRISVDVVGNVASGGSLGSWETDYSAPGISGAEDIVSGPDGALWFTNCGNASVGRITTGGAVSNFTGPGISTPTGIAAGPDGGVWFTNPGNDSIGRVQAGEPASTPDAPSAPDATPGDGQVDLSWTEPADGGLPITGYTVAYRAFGWSSWTTVQPDPATGLSMTIGSLTNGTTYVFKVSAANAVGSGLYSDEVLATPTATPAKADQAISFTAPTDVHYGNADSDLGATASSGLAVTYASSTTGVCAIVSGQLHVVAAGSCTVTASQAGNASFNAAPDVTRTFSIGTASLTVTARDRSIMFGQATPSFDVDFLGFVGTDGAGSLGGSLAYSFAGIGSTSYSPSATPPTHVGSYSITPSGLTSSNYTISFVAAGYTISAASVNTELSWAGSVTPNPALVGQQVSFPGIVSRTTSPSTISDTNLTVQLRSWGNGTCSFASGYIVRDTQSIDAAGQVTLHFTPGSAGTYYFSLWFAGQASGDYYYGQASTAGCLGLTVNLPKANQTISFTAPSDVTYGDADLSLGATASSGLTVGYASSTPSVCSIVLGQLHVLAAGSCTITASQAGNANYNPATDVTQTFSVGKAGQTISFAALASKTYGDPDFTVSASASSELTVGFAASGQCTIAGVSVHLTAAGNCTITASQAGNLNYNPAPNVSRTFTIGTGEGSVAYIGQTLYVTSGPNSSTAQVTLTASVQAAAGDIANARVTFTDDLTGTVLARGVRVSPVIGASTPTGTAGATVTLSSGKYGAQGYLVRVRLDPANGSSYDNDEQLGDPTSAAYTTLTVMVPGGTNTAKGDADPTPLAPAGTYGTGTDVHYTIGLKYNKGGSNPQGHVLLSFDFGGYRYYIKSNSISSIVCTKSGNPCRDLAIYTKASIYRVDALGQTTSVDGNVTVRVDVHDAGGAATGDTIGFTVLSSKSGMLYYSNNWTYDPAAKAWRTVQQPVSATNGFSVQIN